MLMFLIEGDVLHAELNTNKYRDYINTESLESLETVYQIYWLVLCERTRMQGIDFEYLQ